MASSTIPATGTRAMAGREAGRAAICRPDSFITYVQNHDQIGNRADSKRLSARIEPDQARFRALREVPGAANSALLHGR